MPVSPNTLQAVFELYDDYTVAMKKIIESQKEFEGRQKQADQAAVNFQSTLGKTEGKASSAAAGINQLVSKLAKIVTVTALAKKGWDLMWESINTSAMQKMQETTFGALLNNRTAGSAVYNWVSEYAKTSMLGREDLAKGMTNFLTYSRNADELERMVKMTERLYAKDPTQEAAGAVFALKEILSGDTMSMRNRFNISGFDGASIRSKMQAGDVTGALDEIDAVLTRFGASQEVVDRNFKNMTVQAGMFATNIKSAFGEEAAPVMEEMGAMWARLNEDFAAGKFQPFINTMVSGFKLVGTVVIWAADNLNWLIPVLGGVAVAVGVWSAAQTILNLKIFEGAIAAHAMIWPVTLVIAAVLGLAAAIGIANGGMDSFVDKASKITGLDAARKKMEAGLAQTVPVEITNSSPISVKGDVQIEEESLKWAMDIAGARFFASYSHVVPQLVMQGVQITEKADWREGFEQFGDFIASDYASKPNGAPAMA